MTSEYLRTTAFKSAFPICANAHDADATEVRISLPDTLGEDAVIEVSDTGIGMSPSDVEGKYLFIGRNRRGEGQRTRKERLLIGSKGIGKLAGFGIAATVQVIACQDGVQSSLTIDRENLEDLTTLSEQPLSIITTETEMRDGTRVRLLKLNPDLHLPSAEVVRRHLYRTLPKSADFRVFVNSVECTAEDVPGTRSNFAESIPGVGDVTGFYVIANVRQDAPGLAVRVRGRIVKEASLFGLNTRTHGFFTAEKVVGEVNAEFLDPENDSDRHQDLLNTTRDGFLEDSPVIKEFDAWAQDFLRKIIQGAESSETTKRTDALLKRPAVKDRLDRMPPHVRANATSVVRALIAKLKNVEEQEAEELVEWVLRYYESNVLRELMRAIIAADVTDAEKLGQLVEEWGLKQVNSIAEIIKTQIDIIEKLQELMTSDIAKEIEVHRLVEANLWLIREGLELWSSDKPLKQVLEGHLDILYKEQENIRPDLICRSRSNGNEAVILEFKRPRVPVAMEHVTRHYSTRRS
ncbi:MAG TPA: ATP-binding protein [Bryobacteraceae bacterium]|nr:ATP-binding protein [Bryobacteraceae bacterium]